jgi:hypothetical protein
MERSPEERFELAKKRVRNILRAHGVATARILEQKISDAGPRDQRIDPHVLTRARKSLIETGAVRQLDRANIPWYHLVTTSDRELQERLEILEPIQMATVERNFTLRTGQALEIAVFKALRAQQRLSFFGNFPDLDEHDDDQLYRKEEPPSSISGAAIAGARKLDFLALDTRAGPIGIEVKNVREWLYPDREEVRDLVGKCCDIGAVPVLIARRIPYVTFSVLGPCGILLHQTYNQLYARADEGLAQRARDKRLLGYHDIRVGNEPDERLVTFIHRNLPGLVEAARVRFERLRGVLDLYGNGGMGTSNFRGESAAGGNVYVFSSMCRDRRWTKGRRTPLDGFVGETLIRRDISFARH